MAVKQEAIALWPYKAQEDNEIGFAAGDTIQILFLSNEDWYEGCINGKTGFFPANHVKLQYVPAELPKKEEIHIVAIREPVLQSNTTYLENKRTSDSFKTPESVPIITGSSDDADWIVATGEDGVPYYWNIVTQETSWDHPSEHRKFSYSHRNSNISASTDKLDKNSESSKSAAEILLSSFEMIPQEYIKREGHISYKIKKTSAGVETKKSSYTTGWAIICQGFLVIYIAEPAKAKKKTKPVSVTMLEKLSISKDSKKCTISIQSANGALLVLQTNESDLTEWLISLNCNKKESCNAIEYDSMMEKLRIIQIAQASMSSNCDSKDDDKHKKFSIDDTEEPTKATVKARMNAFFKQKVEKKKDHEAVVCVEDVVFGGSLEKLALSSGKTVPAMITNCIEYIEKVGGLKSQGIYRLSGNASIVQKYKAQINNSKLYLIDNYVGIFEDTTDVNVIAALIKLEIAEPVIPFAMYEEFITVMKIEDYNNRLCEIKTLVQLLPKAHYDTLEYLIRHLLRVSIQSEENKMDPSNLAIVFGPSLIRVVEKDTNDMQAMMGNMVNMTFQNSLIEAIITQTEWMFDGNPN